MYLLRTKCCFLLLKFYIEDSNAIISESVFSYVMFRILMFVVCGSLRKSRMTSRTFSSCILVYKCNSLFYGRKSFKPDHKQNQNVQLPDNKLQISYIWQRNIDMSLTICPLDYSNCFSESKLKKQHPSIFSIAL